MALNSRRRTTTDLKIPNRWKLERETSPGRTKVWTEPPAKTKTGRKVPVVYYISRNGQLQQPHFIEVPLSFPEGLYLRDVIDRLNLLRGKGMATMYSWSSKRSYKSGYVWQDLAENDFIYPAQGNEYVLKGSELLEPEGGALITKSDDRFSSSFNKLPTESVKSGAEHDFPAVSRRRNQSWAAVDFGEYNVYKSDCAGVAYVSRAAADASTQTDEKWHRQRAISETKEEKCDESCSDELSREEIEIEISPPPSDSSPETLETLMKSEPRVVLCVDNRTVENQPNGRFKATSVLMQLLSCGSLSFKDCGPALGKEQNSLVSQYKLRLPRCRGRGSDQVGKGAREDVVEPSFVRRVNLEEKEYFSGSLIETKKKDEVLAMGALKRSNSCNADRTSPMGLMEKETEKMRGK